MARITHFLFLSVTPAKPFCLSLRKASETWARTGTGQNEPEFGDGSTSYMNVLLSTLARIHTALPTKYSYPTSLP